VIELRGRRLVEEPIIAAGPHALCGCRPPAPWMASGLDDQPARFSMELNFFRKIRLIEQRLGDTNPARIADPDDARLRGHCAYSVATVVGVCKRAPSIWKLSAICGNTTTNTRSAARASSTLNIYTHVVDASHRKAIEDVEERLFGDLARSWRYATDAACSW
jgi:hypothetical protein